jgi:hypothetical protein
MSKSKKDIKKLIADLHSKQGPASSSHPSHEKEAQAVKGSKGAKRAGTYRPKI